MVSIQHDKQSFKWVLLNVNIRINLVCCRFKSGRTTIGFAYSFIFFIWMSYGMLFHRPPTCSDTQHFRIHLFDPMDRKIFDVSMSQKLQWFPRIYTSIANWWCPQAAATNSSCTKCTCKLMNALLANTFARCHLCSWANRNPVYDIEAIVPRATTNGGVTRI